MKRVMILLVTIVIVFAIALGLKGVNVTEKDRRIDYIDPTFANMI